MPNSCSAPGCKSNYTNEEHIPTFKMPEKPPEVRHAWIRALHREDIGHLKAVYVCLKHFHEEDILFTHKIPSGDGTFTEIPPARPMLREGAIPRLLPGCPSYYSNSSSKRTRLSFESKEDFINQVLNLSLQSEEEEKEKFSVRTIQDLKVKLNFISIPVNWSVLYPNDHCVNFVHTEIVSHTVSANMYLNIDSSLNTAAFVYGKNISLSLHGITSRHLHTMEVIPNVHFI